MKNTSSNKKGLKGYFLAFLIVALAFLAVGLGTLGSVYGTGSAFELRAKRETDTETPRVDFRLSNPTNAPYLRVTDVYVNIAAIYAEPGTSVTLRVERSTSGTTFTGGVDAVFENYFTPVAELDENGKPVKDIPAPDVTDGFFRFVAPFDLSADSWRISTQLYARIYVKSGGANVLVNEVVFVGEELDSNYVGTGKTCVIPATVYDVTHASNESKSEAIERAGALVDRQRMPLTGESSFVRFGKDEVYSLKTIAEMRLGDWYAADSEGNPIDAYIIDGVYGPLGNDILALGTLIFGMSPFGLRFFPMLAAFGALVVLARLVVRLTRSEKAGFVFSLVYALSALTLCYGHVGTPLFLGVFFFALSLDLVHRFYADGIKKANFFSVLPLFCAGLSGAAAVCVNSAFAIPMAGVLGLFIAGMVRQQKAKKYYLEKALAEPDPEPVPVETAAEASGEPAPETKEHRAGRVIADFRFKNVAAPVLFVVSLVFGVFLFALVGILPAHTTYLKALDNVADPTLNVFTLAWTALAGGFTGANAYGSGTVWLFGTLFRGEGLLQAATLAVVNPVALIAGAVGTVYAVVRLIMLLCKKERGKAWRAEVRTHAILLAGLALSLAAAFAVRTGSAFVLLAYLFAFLLAAVCFGREHLRGAARVLSVVGAVLLGICFAALIVFIFSIPLPSSFMDAAFDFVLWRSL